jgi:5-methylcytosine-specific restriction endonuclease McrA
MRTLLPPVPVQTKLKRSRPPKVSGDVVKYKKQPIPIALKESLWITKMGRVFEGKCKTTWCKNTITAFDFQAGHDVPESKGGPTTLENLIPICTRCNQSMGDRYTFKEWCALSPDPPLPVVPDVPVKKSWWCC